MNISEFNEKDLEVIAHDYAELKEAAAKRCANQKELDVVQKAFDFANDAHKGIRRRSGEPYILHPIAVAKIVVSDIGLGYKSISAALLHDVVEDTDYTTEDIRNLFGDKIASLVEGLTKIKTVLDKEDKAKSQSMQAENFKRILLTINDDIRVVLIKLADRLHNCRTIEFMPEYKRDKILSETMFIFIPLAHRLGLYSIKSEMEDIWLSWKEPEAFKDIVERTSGKLEGKKREIEDFIVPIEEMLKATGLKFEVKKRLKSPYSIWHKMQTKGVSIDQIYDLYAVRIIFDLPVADPAEERAQCYNIFSRLTAIYQYKPDRVRDWVSHPKSNGYEALHCTVMSNAGVWVEVQIRSRRMNDIAEKGIAAHWAYKKNGISEENESDVELWINKIKEILVNPDVNSLELLDIIHNDLTSADIFVFTPKGDQVRIQKGFTALDFAYMIHTEIGNRAIAAKANMKLVPLSYVLRTGDQIEIITAETESPKQEWLDFLVSRRARNIVTSYLKDNGLWIEIPQQKEESEHSKKSLWSIFTSSKEKPVADKKESFIISSADKQGRKYKIADCCNPIPGDPIVGFKGEDGVITVHKKTCRIANSLAAKFGDKIVIPQWENSFENAFLVRLSLRGIDRIGVLNEITRYISLVLSMNIREFALRTEGGVFQGFIVLYVHDTADLDKLISRLTKIEGMEEVVRTDLK